MTTPALVLLPLKAPAPAAAPRVTRTAAPRATATSTSAARHVKAECLIARRAMAAAPRQYVTFGYRFWCVASPTRELGRAAAHARRLADLSRSYLLVASAPICWLPLPAPAAETEHRCARGSAAARCCWRRAPVQQARGTDQILLATRSALSGCRRRVLRRHRKRRRCGHQATA